MNSTEYDGRALDEFLRTEAMQPTRTFLIDTMRFSDRVK